MFDRLKKVATAIQRPAWRFSLRHGVAPASEHLEVIRMARPATLIDIGANKGQFSIAVRGLFPNARIIAFEPLKTQADIFERLFRSDPGVELQAYAIAEAAGTATFHIADRPDSSSLFGINKAQSDAFGVREASSITVELRRLDQCVDLASLPKPILMKIDVQGAELRVLKGLNDFSLIDFLYVELSFVELYDGQPLASEVIEYARTKGLVLRGIYNQVSTDTFGPTQADFLFSQDQA